MFVDLHCHTKYSNRCSTLEPRDLVKQAKKLNIDAVCITDHDYFWPLNEIASLSESEDFQVFGGVEVTTDKGQILVFGVGNLPFHKCQIEQLIQYVNSLGGVCIPCHPFRSSKHSIKNDIFNYSGFAAIETLSGRCLAFEDELALEAAKTLNLPTTGGSDGHSKQEIGYFLTEFDCCIKDTQQLIREIKAGRCRAINPRGKK